mgnify:CR=1 FL=1
MEKKPKLLNKKRILMSGNSSISNKIVEQALKNIEVEEIIEENIITKFLSKVFMTEPKLVIFIHEKVQDNIEFAKHIRNNPKFLDLPIIALSLPLKKDNMMINKKIADLNIKYFYTPCNVPELSKTIKDFLST